MKTTRNSALDLALGCITLERVDELSLCPDRICEQFGHDPDFRLTFGNVKTSIDIIPSELLKKNKRQQ